eukprot:GHVS01089385.1.p1 GENE.GHVS01089385.1~~GHVS01089385.1.p1  ORF type:complete len:231 (+),score=24.49 GHVS01089385.1:326-1018(+)
MSAGQTMRYFCRRPLVGEYVSIHKNEGDTLISVTLCEIEVYEPVNVALHKPTEHSSTGEGEHGSALAFMGNRSQSDETHSHTETGDTGEPWWTVDLGQERIVGSVLLYNGEEQPEQPRTFEISVGPTEDKSTHQTCFHRPANMAAGEQEVFQCDQPVRGRYVTVMLHGEDVLSLCNVEVYEAGQRLIMLIGCLSDTWSSSLQSTWLCCDRRSRARYFRTTMQLQASPWME